MVSVKAMTLIQRLEAVLLKAAALLPGEVGQRLRSLITPEALTTMAVVVSLWVASHLVGVGAIADVAMLVIGMAAIGTSAIEAGKLLVSFALKTESAKTEVDLNSAAKDLAHAITLLGVDVVAVMLLRGRPKGTFATVHRPEYPIPTYAQFKRVMPAAGPFRIYKPTVVFTRSRFAGQGGTNPVGIARIGTDRGARSSAEAFLDVRRTVYHEQMHQWITQGFSLLGRPALYVRMNAYKKSFILRYLEEAAAETRSQALMRNLGKGDQIVGYKFPFDGNYTISLLQIRSEAKGVLLGPVTVGGVTYQAYFGKTE